MIAIDVSQSTKAASGADVDGDGEFGENPHEGLYLPGRVSPTTSGPRIPTTPSSPPR